MTELNGVYRCKHCGNMVESVHAAGGTLTCCGDAMELLAENSTDAAQEKHVPVIEKVANGYKVTVGSVEHPMTEEHYIEWIEVITDKKVLRKYLKPGDKPFGVFKTDATNVTARAYCNLHGLWANK